MIRRFILPILLLAAAVGLAALPETAAVTRTAMERPPSALVGPDSSGALSLASFNNVAFSINDTTFSSAGTVTNRFSVPITVTMTITPTITQSCQSFDNNVCTVSAWSLVLCGAADQTSGGAKQCKGSQSTWTTFTGVEPGTSAAQSLKSITLAVGQTIYLFAKGGPRQTSTTSRLCAQAAFALSGTSSTGQSVRLSDGAYVPRRQIYQNGTVCP